MRQVLFLEPCVLTCRTKLIENDKPVNKENKNNFASVSFGSDINFPEVEDFFRIQRQMTIQEFMRSPDKPAPKVKITSKRGDGI